MTEAPIGIADLSPADRLEQQKAWNWYDWANSAFYTTVLSVLFAPYMISVAGQAAGCADRRGPVQQDGGPARAAPVRRVAAVLPDQLRHHRQRLGAAGRRGLRRPVEPQEVATWPASRSSARSSACCCSSWRAPTGRSVQPRSSSSSILGGCSLTAYYAIMVDISTEDERDHASSRGWAFGYLGGGLLLLLNLVLYLGHDSFGLSEAMSVRFSLLSAGIWWAGFTIIPLVRLKNYAAVNLVEEDGKTLLQRSFGQLFTTLREMKNYPMTLTFLIAYLFYNDGIQTVIYAASTYGEKQLGFDTSVLIGTILIIQFVAFGGALFFGRLAAKFGAYRSILWGTYAWMVIVVVAMFLPARTPCCSTSSRWRSASSWAAPRRSRGRSSACSSRGAAKASTSASTTLPSAEPRGSGPCCSAWSSR